MGKDSLGFFVCSAPFSWLASVFSVSFVMLLLRSLDSPSGNTCLQQVFCQRETLLMQDGCLVTCYAKSCCTVRFVEEAVTSSSILIFLILFSCPSVYCTSSTYILSGVFESVQEFCDREQNKKH